MSTEPRPSSLQRIVAALRRQALVLKAMSFASVGLINSLVDLCLFLLALKFLTSSLIVANVLAWSVAVSGSYVMNTFITFAAESGRRLNWRSWLAFVAFQILGLVAATATLVLAAKAMPVLYAKLLAIGVSFLVNFSMSNFVVFRKRKV
ncbi:MAG: GtrA family protein [Pseudorhodoplanes sp.]